MYGESQQALLSLFGVKMTARFEELRNKTIESVWIREDKSEIIFCSGPHAFYYRCDSYGSDVWIEHFEGLKFLINQIVIDIEVRNWSNVFDDENYDGGPRKEAFFYTLKTNRGFVSFEVRSENESSYYYGQLEYEGSRSFGTVKESLLFAKDILDNFTELKEDF